MAPGGAWSADWQNATPQSEDCMTQIGGSVFGAGDLRP